MTDRLLPDGSQLLVGFGRDAAAIDADDRDAVQRALDRLVPGLEIIDATTHDWLADEFARGTWAIHRPGWYTRHHAAMRGPESGLVFAGSDLADGWSGFVDGAIESGLRAATQVQALLRPDGCAGAACRRAWIVLRLLNRALRAGFSQAPATLPASLRCAVRGFA